MLLSISLILIVGMFMGWLCQKCRLPSLLGMLATGMVLGPYVLNLLDGSILGISPELRKMALIIILTRAGLGLDTSGLKKLGRPAVLKHCRKRSYLTHKSAGTHAARNALVQHLEHRCSERSEYRACKRRRNKDCRMTQYIRHLKH